MARYLRPVRLRNERTPRRQHHCIYRYGPADPVLRPLRRTPFTHLAAFGRTGYSFYLVHGPVVKLFSLLVFPLLAARGLPAAAYWLATPLCAICAAGAAALLYLTVEKPCPTAFSATDVSPKSSRFTCSIPPKWQLPPGLPAASAPTPDASRNYTTYGLR